MINYPEFDWPLGHVDGGISDPAKVITDMKVFDSDLGSIEAAYRQAGILKQTLFVITADHGMMPISRLVPASVVENAVTQAGTSAPDIATGSADYVWLADDTKSQAVAENIVKANDPGIQTAYYLVTTNGKPQYVNANPSAVSASVEAANQYLLDALLNGHQPSVVVFGREGVSFADPKNNWKGDHGGNSWQSQHVPLILAGPGINSGVVTARAAQLEDIAPTILTDMGVPPTGMDGNVLADALVRPPSSLQQSRTAEIRWLDPVMSALKAGG
jgi:arylsulfatase A-like enzyme